MDMISDIMRSGMGDYYLKKDPFCQIENLYKLEQEFGRPVDSVYKVIHTFFKMDRKDQETLLERNPSLFEEDDFKLFSSLLRQDHLTDAQFDYHINKLYSEYYAHDVISSIELYPKENIERLFNFIEKKNELISELNHKQKGVEKMIMEKKGLSLNDFFESKKENKQKLTP
jgi:hypothetical protein